MNQIKDVDILNRGGWFIIKLRWGVLWWFFQIKIKEEEEKIKGAGKSHLSYYKLNIIGGFIKNLNLSINLYIKITYHRIFLFLFFIFSLLIIIPFLYIYIKYFYWYLLIDTTRNLFICKTNYNLPKKNKEIRKCTRKLKTPCQSHQWRQNYRPRNWVRIDASWPSCPPSLWRGKEEVQGIIFSILIIIAGVRRPWTIDYIV